MGALRFVLLAAAAAPIGGGTARAQSGAASGPIDPRKLAALVDSVFAAGMPRERIPGAAFVLVQDGHVVLAKGYGKADVASGRAVDPARTIFPIASISKVFTATAVMQLADAGRLDLDADVNRYLTSARVPPTYTSRSPQPISCLIRPVSTSCPAGESAPPPSWCRWASSSRSGWSGCTHPGR